MFREEEGGVWGGGIGVLGSRGEEECILGRRGEDGVLGRRGLCFRKERVCFREERRGWCFMKERMVFSSSSSSPSPTPSSQ